MFFPCGFLGGMVAVGVGNGIIKRSETKKLQSSQRRKKEEHIGARLLYNDVGFRYTDFHGNLKCSRLYSR